MADVFHWDMDLCTRDLGFYDVRIVGRYPKTYVRMLIMLRVVYMSLVFYCYY